MKRHAYPIKIFTVIFLLCFVLLASSCDLVTDEAGDPTQSDSGTKDTVFATEELTVQSEKPEETEESTEPTEQPTEQPTEEPKDEPRYPEWIFAGIPEIDESKFDPENPSSKYAIVPEGTYELQDSAFYKKTELLGVKLPSSLRIIGSDSFLGCTSLKKIIIPEGVTEIKSRAFWECSKLETLYLPSTLTTLGKDVFDACDSLRQVVIPEGITTLSEHLFFNCKYLNSIALPASIEKLDKCCFAYCIRLKNIYFLGTVEQWNSIEKVSLWYEGTRSFTVTCTDGTVEY